MNRVMPAWEWIKTIFRLDDDDDDDVEKGAFAQELQHSLEDLHSEDGKVSEMIIFVSCKWPTYLTLSNVNVSRA